MKVIFDEMMDKTIIPFFKSNGFEQKDINSNTNKTLGIESFYFYKIVADLNFNFYFESNSENSTEKYEFMIDFGIYSTEFNNTIGFPINSEPSGLGNTFCMNSESLSVDGKYWKTISSEMDISTFANSLIAVLQKTLDEHNSITNANNLIEFCINKPIYFCTNSYMIRYLKITENQKILDEYVAYLRTHTADGSEPSEYFLKEIEKLLDSTELKQKVINNFPETVKVPKSWLKVLDWAEKNPHTEIGGHFEVNDDSNNMIKHWFDADSKIMNNFAVIGETSSQAIFCIWNKDKKSQPIVCFEEGGRAKVLTADIEDFIQLLAIGYYEIEIADFDKEPIFEAKTEHWRNEKFQAFYAKTFKKDIPKTGAKIVDRKGISDEVLLDFLCENDSFWKQWKNQKA
jgi:hypothetical protein